MSMDEIGRELERRNRNTQLSLAIFCGIGILFLVGIIWGFIGFH